MRSTFGAVAVVAVAVLSGCGQMLYLEGEAPVCQTMKDVKLPLSALAPIGDSGRDFALRQSFDFDLSSKLPAGLDKLDAAMSVKLTGKDGTKFDFVDSGSVTVTPADSSLPEQVVARIALGDVKADTLTLSGDSFDLMPYLKSGSLTYGIAIEGRKPSTDLTVDIEACANLKVRWNYGDTLASLGNAADK